MNKTDICEELSQNFIDFSYEANSQRAFPDARDGLKPGQRACLWEMYHKGYTSNKPHVKSAKVSGGVAASWWPHGTTAIYETFARMSQDWINNIPEVDWHGMNGSQIISGEPASDRYTEARLSKIVEEGMFDGIKKNKVPMIPNFSEDDEWPEVLPAIFPRLLVNGSQGIGVTIANCWLPVPFTEAAAVILKYIDCGEVDVSLIAPSFPSGGIIINKDDIHTIYETGKGKVILRGRAEIKGRSIFVTEMPYQVYVEPYIEKVKELIKNDELTGIDNIYNRSGKKGICIEIICDEEPDLVLQKLYNKTDLQSSYNANQWALVGKTPMLLTLKDYCKIYVDHNKECIKRETKYDLDKAQAKEHIIDGILIALEDIDNVIKLIKTSESAAAAKVELMSRYKLDEDQAKAILDMRLSKLAHLEKMELENEKKELVEKISQYNSLLASTELQLAVIKEKLSTLVQKYGDARKTELQQITFIKEEKEKTEVIPEDCIVIITESSLIKRIPTKSFRTQKRNTTGIKNGDDIIKYTVKTNTLDVLMVFTSKGKMYRISVDAIPEGTNVSRGTSIRTLMTKIEDEEVPMAYSSLKHDTSAKFVFFATKGGLVKKVPLDEYRSTKKSTGIIALSLRQGDALAAVTFIEDEEIMLITKQGMSIRFAAKDMPISSRIAQGVKGIALKDGDEVLTCLPVHRTTDNLALVAVSGLGKQVPLAEFSSQNRGGRGLICYKEEVAGVALIDKTDSLLISGDKSSLKIGVNDLPVLGKTAQGNIILKNNNKVISVVKI